MLRSKNSRHSHSQPLTASISSKLQNDNMAPSWSFRALSEPPVGRVSKSYRNTCKPTTPLAVRAMFARRTRSVNSINTPNNEDLKARNKMLFAAKRHARILTVMEIDNQKNTNRANIEFNTFSYLVVSEKLPQFSGQWTRLRNKVGHLGFHSVMKIAPELDLHERTAVYIMHHLDYKHENFVKINFSKEHGPVTVDEIALCKKILGDDTYFIPWVRNKEDSRLMLTEFLHKRRENTRVDDDLASMLSGMEIDEKDVGMEQGSTWPWESHSGEASPSNSANSDMINNNTDEDLEML